MYDTWPFIQYVIVEKRIPKKMENRVLGKQVLAELRLANDFFGDFCLTTLYFQDYSFANRKNYSLDAFWRLFHEDPIIGSCFMANLAVRIGCSF